MTTEYKSHADLTPKTRQEVAIQQIESRIDNLDKKIEYSYGAGAEMRNAIALIATEVQKVQLELRQLKELVNSQRKG